MFPNPDVSFALGNSETWTAWWIVGLCVMLTYCIAVQGASQDKVDRQKPQYRPRHPNRSPLSAARKAKAAKLKTQRELARQHRTLRTRKPFAFMKLPEELRLLILSLCADWTSTYRALVLVSRDIHRATLEAFLPRMPIILLTLRACTSFGQLLFAHPGAENLVQHLFIWPPTYTESCIFSYTTILLRCRNVKSLACTTVMLYFAAKRGEASGTWNHQSCSDLTLLPSGEEPSVAVCVLPENERIRSLLEGVTRLRVPSDDCYRGDVCFTRLIQLSLRIVAPIPSTACWIEKQVLSNNQRYPVLQTTVVTLKQSKLQHIRITKKKNSQLYSFEIPDRWTEVELWRRDVQQRGIWEMVKNWRTK